MALMVPQANERTQRPIRSPLPLPRAFIVVASLVDVRKNTKQVDITL
jgi:hypothetical protein